MIIKLKCVDNVGNKYTTSGMEYDALVDENDIYVIRNDDGHFSFVVVTDIAGGKWEVVN